VQGAKTALVSGFGGGFATCAAAILHRSAP
jgi:hypothetical protein